MTELLCRNRVKDYDIWKEIFDEQIRLQKNSGLKLTHLWCEVGDRNNVFFLFQVEDEDRARKFLEDPVNADVGEKAGVIDGEYFFIYRNQ